MKALLAALLLLGPLASASAPAQERAFYPSDYEPQPCAPQNICTTLKQSEFHQIAALRGFELPPEWVLAHWDEIVPRMQAPCAKVANCQAVPGNHWVWCKDLLSGDFVRACDAYSDAEDRRRCTFFVAVFFTGQDGAARGAHAAAQQCAIEARKGKPERTLAVRMVPEKLPPDFDGRIVIHAIDAESRLPVMARVSVDGPNRLVPVESMGGVAVTGYKIEYKLALKRVPRSDGHRDVAVPVITVRADGYTPVEIPIVTDRSSMIVEMSPKKLRRGKNTITISARDSVTGEPVDARVMGDDRVLGKTNRPFELDWKRGQPLPEIWVTSLYDRYDDVVVVKGRR
ncbi:MAG TPA: hypothetical protein VFO89_16370 [Thermoanaerobaculia bacterium]|nr:hypothetical protein [Thermoanaerobaculia bacterium]